MSDHLVALAGDNEPNAEPRPPDWVTRTVAKLQQWIWDVGQDLGLTVCSPSLQQSAPTLEEDYSALSAEDVGDLCDVVAIHNYPPRAKPVGADRRDQYRSRGRDGTGQAGLLHRGADTSRPPTTKACPFRFLRKRRRCMPRGSLLEYVRRGMRFWRC